MKNISKLLAVVLMFSLFLCACAMKMDMGMIINKDKNVSLELIYALDNQLIDLSIYQAEHSGENASSETETSEDGSISISSPLMTGGEMPTYTDAERWDYLEKNGTGLNTDSDSFDFKDAETEKFEEGEFKGYKYLVDLGDLDELSVTEEEAKNLDIKYTELYSSKTMFIKDGDTYRMIVKSDVSGDVEEPNTTDLSSIDPSAIGIYASFKITLPNKAIRHNATSVSEDGLTYTWNVNKSKEVELEFKIEENKVEPTKAEEIKPTVAAEPTKAEEIKPTSAPEAFVPEIKWRNSSNWAKEELDNALKNNLVPDIFNNEDLTVSISRREFAHVAVKLYEAVKQTKAYTSTYNPFTDTDDPEVLKAFNLNITKGTSDTTFSPDNLITREEMAVMLARTLSSMGIDTTIDLEKVSNFADDDQMHSWGKDAIYYMSMNNFIKGVGDNKFDVSGRATREAALLISSRIVAK